MSRLKPDALGVLGILFLVLSAQAPLTGIAGALPIAVLLGNGPAVPAAYLVVGLIILLFSVGFAAMGRHVVDAGAFYVYIGKGSAGRPAPGAPPSRCSPTAPSRPPSTGCTAPSSPASSPSTPAWRRPGGSGRW
ncbi:hypothetical protein [Thermocatellispora tengchongensis]|uniref:hypothetical protein n=1 Tax=Thermocatellispora tengchongensis TaxID=1073253 RepID=UPI00362D85C1